ncbi:hypothetical protein KDA00_04145 [Candidatus Saccharibacteria bacterium]|nr:hypothetical protein [Candidatus Saccharibacteria bacterium]
MNDVNMITELVGIMGGLIYLVAFIEVALGRWKGTSFYYESFNLIGALFLGYYSFAKFAYTNIVLNIVWGTVAFYGVYHAINRHKKRKKIKHKNRRKT